MIFRKRKLGKDYDGTKNSFVLKQLVAIWGGQYCPIFEPFLDCLLTAPHLLLHLNVVWIHLNNSRAFHQLWRATLITTICLNPLSRLQEFCQPLLKNHFIIPNVGKIRPSPPANVTGLDA